MPESFRTFASSGIHGEGYVRFSTANSIENIKEAIDRIGKLRVEERAAPGRSIARVLRPLARFHRSARKARQRLSGISTSWHGATTSPHLDRERPRICTPSAFVRGRRRERSALNLRAGLGAGRAIDRLPS